MQQEQVHRAQLHTKLHLPRSHRHLRRVGPDTPIVLEWQQGNGPAEECVMEVFVRLLREEPMRLWISRLDVNPENSKMKKVRGSLNITNSEGNPN